MSAELQARARAFLQRRPSGMAYVPGSSAEQFIASYAANGQLDLDPEAGEFLTLCIFEAQAAALRGNGEIASFFR